MRETLRVLFRSTKSATYDCDEKAFSLGFATLASAQSARAQNLSAMRMSVVYSLYLTISCFRRYLNCW